MTWACAATSTRRPAKFKDAIRRMQRSVLAGRPEAPRQMRAEGGEGIALRSDPDEHG